MRRLVIKKTMIYIAVAKQMKNLADKILIFIKTLYHTSVIVIDTFK